MFSSRKGLSIETGDTKKAKYFPQVKMKRWRNKANISLRLDVPMDDAIVKKTPKMERIIFPDKECRLFAYSNAFEFSIILKSKPIDNYFDFTVESKNVELWHQPRLTTAEVNEGCVRPAHVVNSIAIYAPFSNRRFKSGKVCHLFRPFAIDKRGKRRWCNYAIRPSGVIRLRIPQEYLDSAKYPVIIDPTFGYTSAGGTALTMKKKVWASSGSSGATAGTGNSIIAYLDGASSIMSQGGLYSDSSGPSTLVTNGCTGTQTPTTTAWYTHTFGTAPTIASSTIYWVAIGGKNMGSGNCYYDSAADGYLDTNYDIVASGCAATFAKDTYYGSRRFSIYCDYTEDGGGGGYIDQTNIILRSAMADV